MAVMARERLRDGQLEKSIWMLMDPVALPASVHNKGSEELRELLHPLRQGDKVNGKSRDPTADCWLL